MFYKEDVEKLYDNETENCKYHVFCDLTDDMVVRASKNIGYKIPKSYIEFLKLQNGGIIKNNNSWLTTIIGITPDGSSDNGLEEQFKLYIEEWGYPNIGFPFGETKSAGEDLYFFDYRNIKEDEEPPIVRIDIETEKIYRVADNFEAFINLLLSLKDDDEEADNEILSGKFIEDFGHKSNNKTTKAKDSKKTSKSSFVEFFKKLFNSK